MTNMVKHRTRLFLLFLGVTAIAAATGVFVANAAASDPAVNGVASLPGAPTALACGGSVNVSVTLTGTARITGNATDVVLVLDLSGSISGSKLAALKSSATAFVQTLDLARNRAGIVTYQGSSASAPAAVQLGASKNSLVTYIAGIKNTNGNSPHNRGIEAAQAALASSSTKALALFSDGQTAQSAAAAAATTAEAQGIRIATVGIGTGSGVDAAALADWATRPDYYQSGSAGFSASELVSDVGAAVATPAAFTLTETPGVNFELSAVTAGATVGGGGELTWSGALADNLDATFEYTATRNGDVDLFSVTTEEISKSALLVTDGSGAVAPAIRTIDVLPCDAALLEKKTCTESACTAGGTTSDGLLYSLNAGSPGAGTEIFVAGLTTAPPAGACAGFDTNANGVQIDIRPLTTPGNFEIKIPKAALGTKKWWQTDVCLGTNLKFITKIGSLANLRPGATPDGGRWWGLLPSVPRYVNFPGPGWVKGPYITYRGPGALTGDAVIRFTVPYVANSAALTTNGLAGYDPRAWGG